MTSNIIKLLLKKIYFFDNIYDIINVLSGEIYMITIDSTTKLANEVKNKYVLGLADKSEIEEVQKLRYDELLLDFDNSKNANGLDASEYDNFCDHLIVKDVETGKIVGTYRLMTNKHLEFKDEFICEEEFDISKLRNSSFNILELGRAVVHKDYRQGTVIKLLWSGIMDYARMHNVRYLFGTASFHGVDPEPYKNAFSKLYYNNLVDDSVMCTAKTPSTLLNPLSESELDLQKAKAEMPSLVKGYLAMGCKVGNGTYIDYSFNSIDVMIILDLENMNTAYFNRMFAI